VTRLSGKVALITGGGTGIGRAIALAFAREGASVAVAGRRLEKLREVIVEVQKAGGAGLAMECDVTHAREVERAVKGTVERFGRLNVLVNNAGTLHVSTVEGISEEEWDRMMTVNLKGPFLMSRAVLSEFRKCGGGAIVNIGSVLGLVAVKDRTAYCASKGGVTMLTKAMAIDHAEEKIRVNCICPSIVGNGIGEGHIQRNGAGTGAAEGADCNDSIGAHRKTRGCGGDGGFSGVGRIVMAYGGGDSIGWRTDGVLMRQQTR